MTNHTHLTAPTQHVMVKGTRFACRRFGTPGGVPLVLNQRFIGTMDDWDPAITDGLARTREIILFNNAGVSSSSGEVPCCFEEMAADAIAFIRAVGVASADVLGFSVGGFVAQEMALQAPGLVRRLVLAGAGPRGGQGLATLTRETLQFLSAPYEVPDEIWLAAHFTHSEMSQAAGRRHLRRCRQRTESRDPGVSDAVAAAQIEAMSRWGTRRHRPFEYLKSIRQPTLVVNGTRDRVVCTVNSFILQKYLPSAQLILYPDANHGSIYQYPESFVTHVTMFLDA